MTLRFPIAVGVHFENNSSKLTSESSEVLDPLAASLKAHPRLRVEVQGHTGAVGSAPYNLNLSQARAEAVREYLVSQGVPASALTAKGYGKTQPVADNKTPAGRAQNRRVVMSVLENRRCRDQADGRRPLMRAPEAVACYGFMPTPTGSNRRNGGAPSRRSSAGDVTWHECPR